MCTLHIYTDGCELGNWGGGEKEKKKKAQLKKKEGVRQMSDEGHDDFYFALHNLLNHFYQNTVDCAEVRALKRERKWRTLFDTPPKQNQLQNHNSSENKTSIVTTTTVCRDSSPKKSSADREQKGERKSDRCTEGETGVTFTDNNEEKDNDRKKEKDFLWVKAIKKAIFEDFVENGTLVDPNLSSHSNTATADHRGEREAELELAGASPSSPFAQHACQLNYFSPRGVRVVKQAIDYLADEIEEFFGVVECEATGQRQDPETSPKEEKGQSYRCEVELTPQPSAHHHQLKSRTPFLLTRVERMKKRIFNALKAPFESGLAVRNGQSTGDTAAAKIRKKAQVQRRRIPGVTPLCWACSHCPAEVIKHLLVGEKIIGLVDPNKYGDIPDEVDHTRRMSGGNDDNDEKACKHMSRKTEVTSSSSSSSSLTWRRVPLHDMLFFIDKEAVVKDLIANAFAPAGADIDIVDNEGNTALYIACGMQYRSVVKLLIELGASTNAAADRSEEISRNGNNVYEQQRHFTKAKKALVPIVEAVYSCCSDSLFVSASSSSSSLASENGSSSERLLSALGTLRCLIQNGGADIDAFDSENYCTALEVAVHHAEPHNAYNDYDSGNNSRGNMGGQGNGVSRAIVRYLLMEGADLGSSRSILDLASQRLSFDQ